MEIEVFSAKWCHGCASLKAMLDKSGVDYRVVDVDDGDNSSLVSAYGIRSLPTTIILKEGELAGKVVGTDLESILEFIENEA